MKHLQSMIGAAALTLLSGGAHAMNVVSASYDATTDELVFAVAFRGTHADHAFTISWGACQTMADGQQEIFGLIKDSDPDDPAKQEFKKTERASLKDFSCRPATVTIGPGDPKFRRTLSIPAQPR